MKVLFNQINLEDSFNGLKLVKKPFKNRKSLLLPRFEMTRKHSR